MLARENMTPERPSKSWRWAAAPTCRLRSMRVPVDAYCTGEPFRRRPRRQAGLRNGLLSMTRDEWRNYILLRADGARGIDPGNARQWSRPSSIRCWAQALWLDQQLEKTATRPSPLPRAREFFNQDPKIIQFVMENPTDRVTYGDLRMIPRPSSKSSCQLSMAGGHDQASHRLRDLRE